MKKTLKKMEHNYIFCEYCAKKNQPSYNLCTEYGASFLEVIFLESEN